MSNLMKKRIFVLLSVFCIIFSVFSKAYSQSDALRIGIVFDGFWVQNEQMFSVFKEEISELLSQEYNVSFPDKNTLTSDWTKDGINSALDNLLNDNDVDIVIALGPIASGIAGLRSNLSKPLFAPFVQDAEIQGIPLNEGSSGVENLNYINRTDKFRSDLKVFYVVYPFRRPV